VLEARVELIVGWCNGISLVAMIRTRLKIHGKAAASFKARCHVMRNSSEPGACVLNYPNASSRNFNNASTTA
jgi:hypothetical protein